MSVVQPLSLLNPGWSTTIDAVTVTYPTSTTEVFVYRQGGASGTAVLTLTITYVDSTKEQIQSVVRS